MKFLFQLLIIATIRVTTFAQSVEISAGSVMPQMTTTQRTSMANPVNGMLVYDTGTNSYWFYQQTVWTELPKGGNTSNYWQLNGVAGNEIKNTNTGGFWSANPNGLDFDSDNTSNPANAPINGDGTRLMWIPSRSAFRVGTVSQNSKAWDADSIGLFSFAAGINSIASGKFSTAIGNSNIASGQESTVFGANSLAKGDFSSSLGLVNKATGNGSVAIGNFLNAKAVGGLSVGFLNDFSDNPSPVNIALTDRIFQIGNGYGETPANAMTILRNGKTGINTVNPEAILHVNGFTKLGNDAPNIKVKKLTGTTGITQNGKSDILHYLESNKILSINVLVEYDTINHRYVPPGYQIDPNYEFSYYVKESMVVIENRNGNSSKILNKPVRVLITYEE